MIRYQVNDFTTNEELPGDPSIGLITECQKRGSTVPVMAWQNEEGIWLLRRGELPRNAVPVYLTEVYGPRKG